MVLQMDAVQLCFAMNKWRKKKEEAGTHSALLAAVLRSVLLRLISASI